MRRPAPRLLPQLRILLLALLLPAASLAFLLPPPPAPAGTTTMTEGFPNIPSAAGAPTGTPADLVTGNAPMYFDSTNNKIYVYKSGTGWLSTAALT